MLNHVAVSVEEILPVEKSHNVVIWTAK